MEARGSICEPFGPGCERRRPGTTGVGVLASRAKRFDGFDLIRIVAALMVVLDHAYGVTGNRRDVPEFSVGSYHVDFGHLGVVIFFLTSGFLVAQSWERDPKAWRFGLRRFARIWPALAVLVLISVFVLGPLVTSIAEGTYFRSKFTYDYLWNMTLFTRVQFRLPGVFDAQPTPAVNGSLWTLPYEAFAYVGVALLGVAGIMRRRALVVGLAVVALLAFEFAVVERSISAPYAVLGITQRAAIHLGAFFLLGMALSAYRDRLRVPTLLAVGAALFVLSFPTGVALLFALGVGAMVIALGMAHNARVAKFHRFGDPSYGIYIFSFPIQQLLVYLGYSPDPVAFFAVSAVISVAAGYLSWWVVERPGMRLFRPPQQKDRVAETGADQEVAAAEAAADGGLPA
jgi:peptidoglycan/LPS O-acetylase OafA/YrhL